MKIGTIIRIISISLVVIMISFGLLSFSNENERVALTTQATFKQLGLDLSGASDLLTNQARAYVQYGERRYYDAYMEEVNVTKTRDKVVAELERLGAPENELAIVERAFQLSQTLAELETRAFEAMDAGDFEEARRLMFGPEYEEGKAPIVTTMTEFQETMASRTNAAAETAQSNARIMLIIFCALFTLTAIVITVSLVSIHRKLKTVAALADCASQMAEGDTGITINVNSGDEIGVLAESFRRMANAIREQVTVIERLADGDLTVDARPRSAKDTMGLALNRMVGSLNGMFGGINASSSQVSTVSRQIANGSQALARGSTEQASAVEQLSTSIAEIARKTRQNADMAERAANLAVDIKDNAEKGNRQMSEMMAAVKEINAAGQNIGKVIKVIDDIAQQTNILALNASIEAARVGQLGKGFAVVAEEVGNLAAKSAGAAKDTEGLIANSIEKAELGVRIADETAASLAEIVSGINESNRLVMDIARSSEEQSYGVTEINKGIEQVVRVIQLNSATAQQSAAASQEMSSQANVLEELVAQFKLQQGGTERTLLPAAAERGLAVPRKGSARVVRDGVELAGH